MLNKEPNDYGQPSQYIVELMPKAIAWFFGVAQVVCLGLLSFILITLIDLKASDRESKVEQRAATQRMDRFDSRQDKFEERLSRVEIGEGRR